MTTLSNLPVCILAGGASRRFGAPKGLARLHGQRLVDIVVKRLLEQTLGPIVLNCDTSGPYSDLALPLIADQLPGDLGPLAGIHAAMEWGSERGFPMIATCTIDVPFIPLDMLLQLKHSGAPSICASDERWHPLIGLWTCELAGDVADFIKVPRSAHSWVEQCKASIVEFQMLPGGVDPFFNINTKADLRKATGAAGLSGQS